MVLWVETAMIWRRRGVVNGGKSMVGALWSLSASLLLPGLPSTWLVPSPVLGHRPLIFKEAHHKYPPLFGFQFLTFCVMATSARLVSSLRRSALSSRAAPRIQCLRVAPQIRRITSATSEPHQPDSKGGLDGPAPSKTIKFTSESYVAITGNSMQN